MVQSIYNNYAPQLNYYPQRQGLPAGYVPSQPMVMQQVQPMPYPSPVDTVPFNKPSTPLPAVNTAIQDVYNAPVYAQQYYSTVPPANMQVPASNNPFITAPLVNIPMPAPVAQVDPVPWVQDPELKLALTKLSEITHSPADVAHLNSIGVNPPYTNGADALKFIHDNQIKVEFMDMGDSLAHAQWINEENKIGINQKYKGKMTLPMALAISDAIYHEAGHAKDGDGVASIQEELNCLSLNVLGYRYQQKHYPEIINANGQSRLISDGVALYPKLFFDSDPQKQALIKRVTEKYGFLPVNSPNHPSTGTPLAAIIKQNYLNAIAMQQQVRPAA